MVEVVVDYSSIQADLLVDLVYYHISVYFVTFGIYRPILSIRIIG